MEFLTAEEKQKLEIHLAELIANRQNVSNRIAEARALGDLKENAEYHAARDEQGMQEAEIRRIEERLRSAVVASTEDMPEGTVFLGSVVRLEDTEDGTDELYKLVGELSDDFDGDEIEVTSSSPMGTALMKTKVGEEVRVNLPRGIKTYKILEIL